jgi:hypothetical protein
VTTEGSASPFAGPTLYQAWGWRTAIRALTLLFMALFAGPSFLRSAVSWHDHVEVAMTLGIVGVLVELGIVRRMGMRIAPDRVSLVRLVGHSSYPAWKVHRFVLAHFRGYPTMFMDLNDGTRRRVPTLVIPTWGGRANRELVWKDGSSTEAVMRLQEHLAWAQQEMTSADARTAPPEAPDGPSGRSVAAPLRWLIPRSADRPLPGGPLTREQADRGYAAVAPTCSTSRLWDGPWWSTTLSPCTRSSRS